MDGQVVVVIDPEGYVGAFPDETSMADALRPYPSTMPVAICAKYPFPQSYLDAASQEDPAEIYPIPYRGCDGALACVAPDRETATRWHGVFRRAELVVADDVKYWQQRVGVISARALTRLREREERTKLLMAGAGRQAAQAQLDRQIVDGFLAQIAGGATEEREKALVPPTPPFSLADCITTEGV